MRIAAAALALSFAGLALASPGAKPKPPSNEDCFSCHGEADAKRADGSTVFVALPKLEASVHGQAGLACVDCHADLAAAADFPHAERLAPAQCSTCHEAAVADYRKSIHAAARQKTGNTIAASCADCHGTHEILPAKDPASQTYALNLPGTCARCHGDPETIRNGPIAIGDVAALYEDSIHGRAVLKSGLVTAPNCKTCHGIHDIRRSSDPVSKVFRGNIPSNCGSCHEGIERLYAEGIHGTLFASGDTRAPVCTDCHTAHAIRRADVEAWRLDVLRECGSCHAQSQETFRDTYHGQVTNLGFARIATCADCHEAHNILPASDPRSTVSVARRVATCQKCHPGVNEKFARYDPHPNPKDRARNPLLFYVAILMKWLVIGVMAFFGVHTVLWFPRSWRARHAEPEPEPPRKEEKEEKE
ncbi:MAG: cytochrome c3 family protein [Thermoanaerobaculia bacterium]